MLLSQYSSRSWQPAAIASLLVICSAAIASPETRKPNTDYKPAFDGQTRAPEIKSSFKPTVTPVASGLKSGWAFEFLPDGRLLVTERSGNLRIVDKAGKVSEPATGLPKVSFEGQGGLLDVALDPKFASNKTIYWSYAEPRENETNGTALAKGVLDEKNGVPVVSDVQVIFRQMPSWKSRLHFGSRIVFNPDGTLFLALGERSVADARVHSQDLSMHLGKIVRLNTDGSVPKDNPFVGRSDAKPEIWSYGHRNIQAAALDPQGRLWDIEHGPRGGDELNRPEPGKNYGWPVITYGIEYAGAKIGDAITAKPGMEQPVYYWDPVIAPSGMIFYTGDMFPEWKNDLFVGGLNSLKLVRLKLQGDKVVGEEWLLQDQKARIRDVQQGPDGAIYVLTESAEGQVLRLGK